MSAIDNLTENYRNIQTALTTESGDAIITVSGVSGNEGLTLDYNLLTAPKQFKIDPSGAHWTDGTTSYDTTLENLVSGLQAVVPPPNATTFKVVNTIQASNNATNSITLDSTVPNIVITDGTITNTIDKNGYTTRNTTANLTHFLNFSDSSTTGLGPIQKTAGLTVNPSTKALSATTVNTDNLNSNASYYINSSKRVYQSLNAYTGYANTTNGYYELAKNAYPLPNKNSSGVKVVSTWTQRTANLDTLSWEGVTWSPELGLFCAVSSTGTGTRVMTSPDGINWTSRTTPTSPAEYNWVSVCWAPQVSTAGRFVVVGNNGVMYSDNGISWTLGTPANNNNWFSVCWSPELSLFVAIALSGTVTTGRAMSSTDGITWVQRTTPAYNYSSVCWSPELGLFCAVGYGVAGNRVITSPDGINWTQRATPVDNDWINVCWCPELGLFVAVSQTGTLNRAMTSPDGITWTSRTTPTAEINWKSISWAPELGLFCVVAQSGTGTRAMSSPDGITWTLRNTPADIQWRSISWAPELGLFCVIANSGTNRVMTSSLLGRPPTSYNLFDSDFNRIDQTGAWTLNGTITNATNATITSDNTSGSYYIPFSKTSGTGNKPLFQDDTTGPLTYNPSTATLSTAQITATTQVNTNTVTSDSNITMNFATSQTLTLTNATGNHIDNGLAANTPSGPDLPAKPKVFMRIIINGTSYRIPLYAAN